MAQGGGFSISVFQHTHTGRADSPLSEGGGDSHRFERRSARPEMYLATVPPPPVDSFPIDSP